MREINLLFERIDDEIQDAISYAKLAAEFKSKDPELAECFFKLSGEERDHMGRLHAQAVRLIDAYKRANGSAPVDMQAVYDYVHRRHIAEAEKIGIVQSLYKKA